MDEGGAGVMDMVWIMVGLFVTAIIIGLVLGNMYGTFAWSP